MFAPVLGAVRADIAQQIEWAKNEIGRQTRHTLIMAVLAILAGLAVLGAIVVGLIALHLWLAVQYGPFVAHGMIGAGLLLLALILFTLVFARRRPRLTARPALQIAKPAALVGTLAHSGYDSVVGAGGQALNMTTRPSQRLPARVARHARPDRWQA
jgi:hypothetical protein